MKFIKVSFLSLCSAFTLSSCGGDKQSSYEYKVVPLAEIDQKVYSKLQDKGAAEKLEGGKWKITDLEAAKSENIMKDVLDDYGKEGWRLSAINQSQLYIFVR